MAKSGVFERDPATVLKTVELKKELQRMANVIADDDDINLEAIDRVQQTLSALKELKLKKTRSLKILNQHCNQETASGKVPEEFICPLSKELMKDPVFISTGKVFIFCFRRDIYFFSIS